MPAPIGKRITIRKPDDFHHHVRDGTLTEMILDHATKRFGRCLIMPNLKPPITTTDMAYQYQQRIMNCIPKTTSTNTTPSSSSSSSFQPLMTLYLTDNTTAEEIHAAANANASGTIHIVGCKYYPAGATTNSDAGVTNIHNCYDALQAMVHHDMVLCIHSEVTHGDIFDRENLFINEIIKPLVNDFPKLKITMEHISTEAAVQYILYDAPDTVKATVTCHHLLYNRNDLLVGGIKPHLYCLPILKSNNDCIALQKAAVSGSNKFFLGTDSAPHATSSKESACGCAGIYTAHAAIELYVELFDRYDSLDKIENFTSTYGAMHYNLPLSTETITLEKKSWIVPNYYTFGTATTNTNESDDPNSNNNNNNNNNNTITPLRAGQVIQWTIVS